MAMEHYNQPEVRNLLLSNLVFYSLVYFDTTTCACTWLTVSFFFWGGVRGGEEGLFRSDVGCNVICLSADNPGEINWQSPLGVSVQLKFRYRFWKGAFLSILLLHCYHLLCHASIQKIHIFSDNVRVKREKLIRHKA